MRRDSIVFIAVAGMIVASLLSVTTHAGPQNTSESVSAINVEADLLLTSKAVP